MIVRIVKMSFESSQIDSFKTLFYQNKSGILNSKGCLHVELLQDTENKNLFFTYSHWQSQEYLEVYRKSDFFKAVWSKTKSKFNKSPDAWSLHISNPKQS